MTQSRSTHDRSWRAAFGTVTGGDWLQTILLALVVAAGTVLLGGVAAPLIGFDGYGFLVAAAGLLGAGAALVVIFGPSWLAVGLFLVKMFTGHQFRSMYVFPLLGIEWHPREFWLFLLLAHGVVRLLSGRARLRLDAYHYFYYLYCFYFVFIAGVGVLHQYSRTEILEECRYPVFLASYLVLATCLVSRRDVWMQARLLLALAVIIAAGATAFFAYTFLTGGVINVQNVYGEYVRRQIGPMLLQSVRPNGHMLYEMCFVVLTALLCCREVAMRARLIMLALLGLFAFAILITMMRTAYVALACSLAALALLSLPRGLRWATLTGIIAAASIVLLVSGAAIYAGIAGGLPELEVSMRARFAEMQGAWAVFARDPLLGGGMGSTFEAMGWSMKVSSLAYGRAEFQTVHNAWMYFLLKGGLVGLVFIVAGLGGILARGYRAIETLANARDRALMRGLVAATAGQLIASLAMPRLTYPSGHVFIAMMTCAFFLMGQEEEPAPARPERK